MRVLVVMALALTLTGAAAADTPHRGPSPLTLGSLSELSGTVARGGSSEGQRLRFIPNQKFALGLVLQNASHVPVVVTDAYVVAPRLTLIHQTGVRFHRFSEGGCSGGGPCPAPSFRIGSGWHPHPRPFTLAPGKLLGVELDLRLGSCADVPGANAAPISHLEVIYRRNGSSRHTVFALGSDALRLRRPKAEDCTFPRSTLWVNDPSHIGTNYYFTIPGSKGDVCTRTGHGLVFRSRAMKNNDRKPERIEIRFPSFAGTGMYGQAIAAAVVGGRTVFHTPALVEMTKATRSSRRVRADKLRPQAATVPYRIYGWMRCRVVG